MTLREYRSASPRRCTGWPAASRVTTGVDAVAAACGVGAPGTLTAARRVRPRKRPAELGDGSRAAVTAADCSRDAELRSLPDVAVAARSARCRLAVTSGRL